LSAFEGAFARGADAVELDVHGTRDGIVVVHHDPEVSARLAPHDLPSRAIAELTAAELARVRLTPRDSIPILADVLAVVPAGRRVYVEIKGKGITERVAEVIRVAGRDCAVHSFDVQTIVKMRE